MPMIRRSAHTALALLATALMAVAAHAADDPLQAARTARQAALDAEAPRLATATWQQAEQRLQAAGRRLEKGDAKAAAKGSEDARQLYAAAELTAIKAALLTVARERVLALKTAGTARFAPRSTARAQELLRSAETTLDADRSQVAAATDLAQQATREAAQAQALARLLRAADARDATLEDLALEWQATLDRAAAAAGLEALPPGPDAAGAALAAGVGTLKERADQQAEELRQRAMQVAGMEEEIRDLDAQLAGASDARRSLAARLDADEHARSQFDRLAGMFPPDQAVALRQGDSVVLRLPGLGFTSGTTRLAPAAKPVLERLAGALALYPGAHISVEGHTDSSGNSAANQRLSQGRAEAVRDYLVRQLQVAPGRVSAVGYGDTRPVASNANAEGRRQNRRIELLFTPPQPAS